MAAIEKEDRLADAKRQGAAQFESIREMVEALRAAELKTREDMDSGGNVDEARERIQEDALSVEVRSGWYVPGACDADTKPAEFCILLCTGGPACRIIGELDEYGQPVEANIEVQDWFQPWTELRHYTTCEDAREILLEYCRQFYFGE